MKRIRPCILVFLLAGCQSLGLSTVERIQGEWRTEIAGLALVSKFNADTVSLGGQAPVPYHITGSVLRFDVPGSHDFVVSFMDMDTMLLIDQTTGTQQTYTRIVE